VHWEPLEVIASQRVPLVDFDFAFLWVVVAVAADFAGFGVSFAIDEPAAKTMSTARMRIRFIPKWIE